MKLALIDIDGVLADDRARLPHALAKEYALYFDPEAMAADLAHSEGQMLVSRALDTGYVVAYLTGRREDRRTVTEYWLDAHGFPAGRLTMRSFTEKMPLANFKTEYIQKILAFGTYTDVVLFDDDPEVIRFVKEQVGPDFAHHCTWQVKEKELVKLAQI